MAHRIDTSTAQKDKFGVGKNGFTRGNPQTGVPATELDDDYFDMLQEEIVGIVEAAGDTLDKTKRNQLNAALGKMFQNKTSATSALGALVPAANRLPYFTGANGASLTDLTSVGRDILASATKAAVLEYLGLGEDSFLPVGVPIPWPLATPPGGWLKCNGATFDTSRFPKLGVAYPGGVLPDLRGEFIRGWDDGRGVDPARTILSFQSSQNAAHVHDATLMFVQANGAVRASVTISEGQGPYGDRMASSGGNESRPRNIAFTYIVRAA